MEDLRIEGSVGIQIGIITIIALCLILTGCQNGGQTEPGLDSESPGESPFHVPEHFSTIQRAISMAEDGDTIIVHPGRYVENISFDGKSLVLGSLFLTTGDTSYIGRTIIDGGGRDVVVMFEKQEDSSTVLSGVTITNGYAWGGWPENCGGGIYCDYSSTPRLENLIVNGNTAENKGGGIFCYAYASPTLVNLEVSGNTAYIGGGIYFEFESRAKVENTIVTQNSASFGGGIYCYSNSLPLLENVMVFNNSAAYNGGGIQCYYSTPILVNVSVFGNSAFEGGGIWCGDRSNPNLQNSIVWGNSTPQIAFSDLSWASSSITIAYSDVQGGKAAIVTRDRGTINWLEGNIDEDPLFVDATVGDFHLQKESPCIDAGHPGPEYYDADGSRNDMGSYGGPNGTR